jgi:hypothetical protein
MLRNQDLAGSCNFVVEVQIRSVLLLAELLKPITPET